MARRSIRLKEHEAGIDTFREPVERTRDFSDHTLAHRPYLFRTDNNGFILTGNEAGVDSLPELVVVGDSFVESLFASEAMRFASQVERGLAVAATPYRVLNAGYSGMTSLHMLGVLSVKLRPLIRPQTKLLLFIGQSDVNALSSPGLYWGQTKTVTPFGSLTADSPVIDQEWKEAFVQMVTSVIAFAQSHGYDFAITAGVFRNASYDDDALLRKVFRNKRAPYDTTMEKRRFVIDAVRSIAQEHAIPLFDASAEFLAQPGYFYDTLHLNDAGQNAYAQALTTWIAEEWLTGGASAPGRQGASNPASRAGLRSLRGILRRILKLR